jgi:5-methylcytosine-specific restriction endonuclease McrA
VSLARELGRDAFLKAVLRTALQLGAPPVFQGLKCSQPSCDRRYHLEFDHIDPVANDGPTAYANLEPLCWPHHQMKTLRDRKAGLLRGKPRGPDPP